MARSRSPSPEVTTTALEIQNPDDDKLKNKNKKNQGCCNRRCCLICGLSFVIIFSMINAGFLLYDYLTVASKKSSSISKQPWDGNYTGTYLTKFDSGHFCTVPVSAVVEDYKSLAYRFAMSEELIEIEKKLNKGPYNATSKREMFEFSSKPPDKPTFVRKILFSSGDPFTVLMHDQLSRFESKNNSVIPKSMLVEITVRGSRWKEVYNLEGSEEKGYTLIVKRHFYSLGRLAVSYQDNKDNSYCKEFTKT